MTAKERAVIDAARLLLIERGKQEMFCVASGTDEYVDAQFALIKAMADLDAERPRSAESR